VKNFYTGIVRSLVKYKQQGRKERSEIKAVVIVGQTNSFSPYYKIKKVLKLFQLKYFLRRTRSSLLGEKGKGSRREAK